MECFYENDESAVGETIMNSLYDNFIFVLGNELATHPKKDEIIAEYCAHVHLKVNDLIIAGYDEEQAFEIAVQELGDPKKLAFYFNKNTESRKGSPLRSTIIVNYFFFLLGLLITMGFLVKIPALNFIWIQLIEKKYLVLTGYLIFWLGSSYVAGIKHGLNEEKLINKALLLSLLPNFILMTLVLYVNKFQEWFHPFIHPAFIIPCVVLTFLFFPVSKWCFKAGMLRGF